MNQPQQHNDRQYAVSLSVDVAANPRSSSPISDGENLREGNLSTVPSPTSHSPTNIFVARLPPWWTKETLKDKFKGFGEILSTKVVPDRHYGFVMFKKPEEAYAAIKHTDSTLPYPNSSVPIHVSIAMHDEGIEGFPNPRLFIRGLPQWATKDHLSQTFSPFGEIVHCELLVDSHACCKGSGFIQFTSTEEATRALEAKESLRLPQWPFPLEIKFSETQETHQKRQNRNRLRQKNSSLTSPSYSHSYVVPNPLRNPSTPMVSTPIPHTPPSYVLVPLFPSPPPGTPLPSPLSTVNFPPASSPVSLSSIYVLPASAIAGDLRFFAPGVTPLVVSTLLQPFGPIEKIYSTGQEHTLGARMADTSIHSHIAGKLNGAVLSTGDVLAVGLYS